MKKSTIPSTRIVSPQRLSYVQTEMAVIGNCARFSLDCGEWLLERCRIEAPPFIQPVVQETQYIVHRARTVLSQLQQLRERVQSQSTFLLNSIAQNEAANTAAIAADSKRDSTAVKIIAILTMLFLPGTFVATFFSMTMFDWGSSSTSKASGGDVHVSGYIWIYWAVSVPLTAFVMVWWIIWNRKEMSRLAQRTHPRNERPLLNLLNQEKV